jgi:hypothetical protein
LKISLQSQDWHIGKAEVEQDLLESHSSFNYRKTNPEVLSILSHQRNWTATAKAETVPLRYQGEGSSESRNKRNLGERNRTKVKGSRARIASRNPLSQVASQKGRKLEEKILKAKGRAKNLARFLPSLNGTHQARRKKTRKTAERKGIGRKPQEQSPELSERSIPDR